MKTFLRWPVLLVLAALIVAALVPTILTANHTSKAHANGGATLSLSAPVGQPGTTIQATGQGFTPSSTVSLNLGNGGALLATATSDTNGNLPSTNITIPDQPGGVYGIIATQGSVTTSAPFAIVPVISLSKTTLFPGASFTLTARGFASQDSVSLYLDSTSNYSFAYFGCNANGDASLSLQLPSASILQGQHSMIAKDYGSNPLTTQISITIMPHVFPIVGKSGMTIQLNGAAFTANEPLSVYWGTTQGQLEGTTTTDAYGNLSFSFTVPSGLSSGSYPITVVRTHQKPEIVSSLFRIITPALSSTPGIRSGQSVKVHIVGFLHYEGVSISWNANGGQTLTWLYADQNGAASGAFTPPSALPGSYILTAIGSDSGIQATSSLNIGPGISKSNGDPGSTIAINGGGFAANETVNVYFQTPKNGVVTASTDATGAFTALLTVPSTYNPATHYYVYAVGTTATDQARATFTFNTPTFSACIWFTCGEVIYNQPVNFSVTNFAIGETVNIIWNYQQTDQFVIASGQNSYYGFNQSVIVPSTPNESSVTIAAVGLTSHLVVTTVVLNDAAISENPSTGKAGTTVTVNGGSFGSNDPITLTLQGVTVATTTSNADGTFSTSFQVPTISGAGNLTLTATDATSGASASVPFQYPPALKVNPTIVQNGDTLIVSGKHFSANAAVYISWANYSYSSDLRTNANGSFTTTILVSGIPSGTYYIVATDAPSNLFVSVAVVVQ